MEQERLKAILESLLFAAGEPVSLMRLAGAIEQEDRAQFVKLNLKRVRAVSNPSSADFTLVRNCSMATRDRTSSTGAIAPPLTRRSFRSFQAPKEHRYVPQNPGD